MPGSTRLSIPANFAVHANFAAQRLSKLSQIRCVSQVHLSAGETAEGESDEAFPACIRVPVGILWSCDFGGLQCLGQGYRRIGLRAGWNACITLALGRFVCSPGQSVCLRHSLQTDIVLRRSATTYTI